MSLLRARQLTMYVCTTAMIILGIYDLIIVNTHGPDASISRFMQESMFNSPVFVFGLGALFGHFVLYFRPKWKDNEVVIQEMIDRLKEIDAIAVCPETKKYYWRWSGKFIKGQK